MVSVSVTVSTESIGQLGFRLFTSSRNFSSVNLTHSLKTTLGATKPATFPGDKTWEQWTSGNDTDSVWADPLFTDIQSGDYSLLPESPAFELGIHEIILGNFGVQESLRYASSLQ